MLKKGSTILSKKLFILTIGGGVVFWVTTIAISLLPIAAEYRSAFSKANIQTVWVASLPAGLIIGCCVSYSLLRFFDKIPTKNPILKSVIISLIALVIATILTLVPHSFLGQRDVLHYFLIGILLDAPRFLFLGIVIGCLYRRLHKSAYLCAHSKEKKINSINKTARMAGFHYFMYFITSVIANMFGRFIFLDAPVTVNHIMAHESQFRIGFVISLFSVVFFLLAAWYLYVLLKLVNQNLALLFLLLNLGGFAIWCFSTLNLFAGLLLLSGADYLKVFQPDQLQAQAMLFINLRKSGAITAQIPYGIWLFPLGYLVFKSGFLPKILGLLLVVDGFGLLICVFQFFLLPGYEVISVPFMAVSFIAELSLTLWLLIKGVKDQEPTPADGQK